MEIKDYDCEEEYDKFSEMYDRYYCSPTWPDDKNIQGLIDFVKSYPGGKNILELGIGTGNVSVKLYMEGYHNITGTDKSPGMTKCLKRKCSNIKLLMEDLYETKYFDYDWIFMVGSIQERVERKKEFFQNMYNQMLDGAFLFMNVADDVEYYPNADPTKDLYKEFFNHNRNFNIERRYRWYTPQHTSGLMTYTDGKTGNVINYKFCIWIINQNDMIELLNKIGFKHLAIGKTNKTGYYEDILVFQK